MSRESFPSDNYKQYSLLSHKILGENPQTVYHFWFPIGSDEITPDWEKVISISNSDYIERILQTLKRSSISSPWRFDMDILICSIQIAYRNVQNFLYGVGKMF